MKKQIKKLSRQIAREICNLLDYGLVSGLGKPQPGKMCVEAAVCFAFGLPYGDDPPCVGRAVRQFEIRLNDSGWSSPQARASGLRRLAIAQLGSDQIDQVEFAQRITLRIIQQIIPVGLRSRAQLYKSQQKEDELLKAASECEAALDLKAAAAADNLLEKTAEIAVQVLVELKATGCQWLDLAGDRKI